MIQDITVEVEKRKDKYLTYTPEPVTTISLYALKPYILRQVLNQLSMDELKSMCKFLDLKVSGTKKDIVKRLWLSDRIKRFGFVTE